MVWTQPHLTLPSVAKLLRFQCESPAAEYDTTLREVEQFADAVLKASERVGLVFVPTWILPAHERWIQTLAWRQGMGIANLLARANLLLADRFAAKQNIILLDSGFWQASLGRAAYDFRMYAFGKILYTQLFFEKVSAEVKCVLRGLMGLGKKVIVCDLDNTLWGGILGDDGPENIKLGAPDALGECFQAFQTALHGMRSRGILLAISSKNDEKLALSVIDDHPAMVLRREDFVAWRINWKDKAENLLELAAELNLGLESFVFLDDSPQERDQIRQILPQVHTPNLPASPSDYAAFLCSLNCFETASLGKEDLERTKLYQAERERKESLDLSGGVEAWLRSLQIEVHAAPLRRDNVPRAVQLLNKTNQFNLSLRRLDEKTFWEWAQQPNNSAYTFHVADRFGDFGLVGLTSLSRAGGDAQIVDFVMSCRVMGKKVEEALLGYTLNQASDVGVRRVIAPLVDGSRNGPAKAFFTGKFVENDVAAIDPMRVGVPAEISLREEI
jgi:FkbH-like protein